jgi:hypothetical protein
MPLDNIDLLSLLFYAPINQYVKALAFETIKHIAKPLSVHMDPVLHIREIVTELDLFDVLE